MSAIPCDGGKLIATSLPEGSIVTLQLSERELPSGMVEVTLDEKPMFMFAVDLRDRVERIRARERGKRS